MSACTLTCARVRSINIYKRTSFKDLLPEVVVSSRTFGSSRQACSLGAREARAGLEAGSLRSTGSLFSLLRPLTGGLRPRPHGRGHLLHLGPGCGCEPRAQKTLTATSRPAEALWGPSRPSGHEELTVMPPVGLVPFQKPDRCSRRLLPRCP